MTKFFRAALLCTAFAAFSTGALAADSLPLKRVVMTTSGLALYEHEGSVTGNEDIALPVRLDGVDDMLKSLVVLDAKGQLGGVTLPGREPLSQTFRGLPFAEGDLGSTVQLLNALRGSMVQADSITGLLMNVTEEIEQTKEGGTITHHRVNILGPDGIKSVILENTGHLQFTDKAVQAQLDRALGALFANRVKDQRTLTVALRGSGTREVGLAYIQDAPLWKSSYRLVLPKDEKNPKALLQGWAVLENTTGQDWKDVSVTLMSGSPVTYKQALYESYYLPRPELPVKVMDRIMPHVDEGTIAPVSTMEENERRADAGYGGVAAGRMLAEKKVMAMNAMAKDEAYGANAPAAAMEMAMPAAPPMPMQMAAVATAAADETASQLVFAFPQPVNLPAGDSLMIPFVSHDLPAEKVWVYQPDTNAQHPLASVSVKNDSGSGLPPGILTLYSDDKGNLLHAGDADMPLIPKGEDRFISFALDTKTKIDMKTEDDHRLGLITINKGVLHQKAVWRNTTTYTIKAPEDESRLIVVEQPRRDGWELEKPDGLAADPDMTATTYRLRLAVAAGKNAVLKATLRREDVETVALTAITPADIDTRMEAVGKDMPPALRRALEKVKTLQFAVYEQQNRLQQYQQERQSIFNDQERLRENLKTVSTDTAIGKRYLKALDAQEDRLNKITDDERDTNEKLRAAQRDLQDFVAGLDL